MQENIFITKEYCVRSYGLTIGELVNIDNEAALNYFKHLYEKTYHSNKFIVRIIEIVDRGDILQKTVNDELYLTCNYVLKVDVLNLTLGTILFGCILVKEGQQNNLFNKYVYQNILEINVKANQVVNEVENIIVKTSIKNGLTNGEIYYYPIQRITRPYFCINMKEVNNYKNLSNTYIRPDIKYTYVNKYAFFKLFSKKINEFALPIDKKNFEKNKYNEFQKMFKQEYISISQDPIDINALKFKYVEFKEYKSVEKLKNIDEYERQFYKFIETDVLKAINNNDDLIIDFPTFFKVDTLKYLIWISSMFRNTSICFNYSRGRDLIMTLLLNEKVNIVPINIKNIKIDLDHYKFAKSIMTRLSKVIYGYFEIKPSKKMEEVKKKLNDDYNKAF